MSRNGIPTCLFRVCCTLCAVAMGTGSRASAQAPSTGPSFEVATIKAVDPSYHFDGTHHWAHVHAASASYWYMSPVSLIVYAYGVEPFQVIAPEWADEDRFDIEARFPEGAGRKDERRMLQALLKDRFKLSFHIEKRQLDGYALVVGKHGAKLTPSLPDPVSPEAGAPLKPGDNSAGGQAAPPKVISNPDGSSSVDLGKSGTQTIKFDDELWAMHFERSRATMEELAVSLATCLGKGVQHVVDETGIKGTYQVTWDCPLGIPRPATDKDAAGMLPSDPEGGSALTQSLDALGLKVEKRKTLQDVYVIDHVEKPSEN